MPLPRRICCGRLDRSRRKAAVSRRLAPRLLRSGRPAGLCRPRRHQQRQLSYEELAFHLEDSASFRAFARLPLPWSPKKSVLHQTIGALRAETWEAVNQALLASAQADKLESGTAVRIDSTVSAALMHEPSDGTLLWDAVRVMTRLLRRAAAVPGAPAIGWRDRRRVAKKRARAIDYSRGQDKKRQLYRELIAAAQATRAELQAAAPGLAAIAGTAAERWCAVASRRV